MDLCELQSQPGLQSKFQDYQNYTEKPCLKKWNQTKQGQEDQEFETSMGYIIYIMSSG